MKPRPTRWLIVVSVFLVGTYPPVIWATVLALTFVPPAAVVPLAAFIGMTLTLTGLWRPTPGGWVGAAVIFGLGWTLSASMLGTSMYHGWRIGTPSRDAAAFAYYTLALVSALVMRRPWSAWAEGILKKDRRAGRSRPPASG